MRGKAAFLFSATGLGLAGVAGFLLASGAWAQGAPPAARGASPADPAARGAVAAAPSAPQAAPNLAGLDISSQVDRSEITIGDRILYEIKVVYPGEGRIELPSVLGNLGSFEVKDYQASEPKQAGKLKIQTWRFNLSTFTVGTYMIPPQLVVYLPPGAVMPVDPGTPQDSATAAAAAAGPKPLVFSTQPIEIKVVRTSAENVRDIADIAPLAEAEEGRPWVLIGLGTAAILALAVFLFLRLRRKSAVATSAKPALPPYEEAMERLSGLNAANLIRQNRARELCFELSEILRKYISRRWEVDALESTTTEFLALVPKLPAPAERRQWIGRFCEATDLVKFANAPLLESDGEELVGGLKDFLRATKPREEEIEAARMAEAHAAKPAQGAKTSAAPASRTAIAPAAQGAGPAGAILKPGNLPVTPAAPNPPPPPPSRKEGSA